MAIAPPLTITAVIIDFLSSAPTLEEIVAFQLPEAVQERGLELLALNRQGRLSPEEGDELEEFTRMGQFITRISLKAELKLAGLT